MYLFTTNLNAQVTGRCLDAQTGEAISEVTIQAGKLQVATTNIQGQFTIGSDTSLRAVFIHPLYLKTSQRLQTPGYNVVLLIPRVSDLDEVTVSAPLLSGKRRDLAGNISVLVHDTLHRQLEPVNLLNRLPGLFMQQGALNTSRVMIRGIGSRSPYATTRIRAYLDDIPLTTGDGNTTIEDLELYQMARTEVIRGPSSTLFGGGLGGAIIFHPDHTLRDTSEWNTLMQAGSFGHFKGLVNGGVKGKRSVLKTTLSHTQNDGFRENSRYSRNNASLTYRLHSRNHSLFFQSHYIHLRAHIPSSINRETWLVSPHKAAANWLGVNGYEKYQKWISGLTLHSSLNKNIQNKAVLYFLHNDSYESRPFNILDDKGVTVGFRDELSLKTGSFSFTTGGEFFNERYRWQLIETLDGREGEMFADNREDRRFFNLFAKADYPFLPGWNITAGGNLHFLRYALTDRFDDDQDQSGDYRYDPVFSPRAAVSGRLLPNLNFYTSVGHGFSVPSVEETLLPEGNINPDLKPEEGINTEAGLRGELLDEHLHFDIAGYYINLKNLLVTKRESESVFYGINAGKTRHYGLETDLKGQWPLLAGNQLTLAVELAHTEMRNLFTRFSDEGNDYSNNRLPGLPNRQTRMAMTPIFNNGLSLRAEWLHTGNQYLNDGNTLRYQGHHLFNVNGSYGLRVSSDLNFRLEAGIRNLLNRHYASMVLVNAPSFGGRAPRYYYPGAPRNGFVRLTINM